MNWQGAIGIAVGVLGLAVSWWTAYWGWRARRSDLDVSLTYGTLGEGQHAAPVIWIRVVNRGAVDIEIESVGLVTPDGRRLACEPSGGDNLSGSSLHVRTVGACWLAPGSVAEALAVAGYVGIVALRAYCIDALGGEFRSATLPFEARQHYFRVEGVQARQSQFK